MPPLFEHPDSGPEPDGGGVGAGGAGRGGAGAPLGSERRGTRVLAQLCSCDPGRFALALSQHIGRSGLAVLPPGCPGRPGTEAPEQHGRPRRWSRFPSAQCTTVAPELAL